MHTVFPDERNTCMLEMLKCKGRCEKKVAQKLIYMLFFLYKMKQIISSVQPIFDSSWWWKWWKEIRLEIWILRAKRDSVLGGVRIWFRKTSVIRLRKGLYFGAYELATPLVRLHFSSHSVKKCFCLPTTRAGGFFLYYRAFCHVKCCVHVCMLCWNNIEKSQLRVLYRLSKETDQQNNTTTWKVLANFSKLCTTTPRTVILAVLVLCRYKKLIIYTYVQVINTSLSY